MDREEKKPFDWNRVYESFDEDSKEWRKFQEAYRRLPKECYQDLESCIAFAVNQHSHVAFARYFLERGWTDDHLFSEAFQIYIEEQEEKEGTGWWYRCRLIKPGYFYDPNVTEELLRTENNLFSGKSSLAQWKQGIIYRAEKLLFRAGFT